MEILVIGLIVAGIYIGLKKGRRKDNYDNERKERIIEWVKKEKNVSDATILGLQNMGLQQIQFALIQQNLMNEQEILRMMHDPYLNPGLDVVVDNQYHGIDNGMEPHQHHQTNDIHNNNDNNGSSGGFNNGL